MTLAEFIKGPFRNEWIEDSGLRVYLRKAYHTSDGLFCRAGFGDSVATLEIVNVTAEHPGEGCFTAFLNEVERKFARIYIENVLNDRFLTYLVTHCGYKICSPKNQYPPCLIWSKH